MGTITTRDNTQISYKDWGEGKPVVFSHGWPLSADAWENQMTYLAAHGFRCIAHDRRGHGRSDQPWSGDDMDTYADDLAELVAELDLGEVTLEVQADGSLQIDWPPAAHARRYRLQMRRAVTETKFTNLKTQQGTSYLLRKQTPGETLEIRVIAANKTGEAGPSPVARVVCPP